MYANSNIDQNNAKKDGMSIYLFKNNYCFYERKYFMLKPIFDFEITKRMNNVLETEGGLLVDLITNN